MNASAPRGLCTRRRAVARREETEKSFGGKKKFKKAHKEMQQWFMAFSGLAGRVALLAWKHRGEGPVIMLETAASGVVLPRVTMAGGRCTSLLHLTHSLKPPGFNPSLHL